MHLRERACCLQDALCVIKRWENIVRCSTYWLQRMRFCNSYVGKLDYCVESITDSLNNKSDFMRCTKLVFTALWDVVFSLNNPVCLAPFKTCQMRSESGFIKLFKKRVFKLKLNQKFFNFTTNLSFSSFPYSQHRATLKQHDFCTLPALHKVCTMPIHNKSHLVTLSKLIRSRPYSLISLFIEPQLYPMSKHLGTVVRKKLKPDLMVGGHLPRMAGLRER